MFLYIFLISILLLYSHKSNFDSFNISEIKYLIGIKFIYNIMVPTSAEIPPLLDIPVHNGEDFTIHYEDTLSDNANPVGEELEEHDPEEIGVEKAVNEIRNNGTSNSYRIR